MLSTLSFNNFVAVSTNLLDRNWIEVIEDVRLPMEASLLGCWKLNFDSSSMCNSGFTRSGSLICNGSSIVRRSFSSPGGLEASMKLNPL